jgi:large subunit ribosomal protein L31e
MVEIVKHVLEREYVIPLRSEWNKVVGYKRARKAVVAVKEFIAKHMKVTDRDLDKVRVDIYLNNEIWYRGGRNAPNKIKVKAVKDSEGIVRVTLAEVPEVVKFAQARHKKLHQKEDKKSEKEEREEKKDLRTEEQKKDEQEKEQSVAVLNEKIEAQNIKAAKHTPKKNQPRINRMALKK